MTATGAGTARRPAPHFKLLLAAVSLLSIGAVLGIAVDRHRASALHPSPLPLAHGSVADIHDAALASLKDHLDLDQAQRRQVDSIIEAHHETLRRTWATLHAELMATVDTVHADLEAVLTTDQRRALRQWLGDRSAAARHP